MTLHTKPSRVRGDAPRSRPPSRVSAGIATSAVLLAVLVAGLFPGLLDATVRSDARVGVPLESAGYAGVPPNGGGATRIDADTEWWGTIFAGGNIDVGNASRPIQVTFRDCTIQLNGSLFVDDAVAGYKPVTLVIRRCTISLASTASQILLDQSAEAVSGSSEGSSLLISNSTIRSIYGTPPFPSGLLLLSGNTRNLARVQIEETTFEFLGRWDTGRTTIATAEPGSGVYSRFTPDSYLRRLTFISTASDMNELTNPGFLLLGDSLPIEDSVFINGFLGAGFTKFVRENTFNLTCRPVYDPFPGAVVERNTIHGKYCKTVDFFSVDGVFRNNTVYDSIVGSGNPSAARMQIVGNTFIRSHTGGSAPNQVLSNNTITGIMYSDAGEVSLSESGNYGIMDGNRITGVATGGIRVQPYLDGYTYQRPTVTNNVVDGFYGSGEFYPGVKIKLTDGGILSRNAVSSGYLGFLLDRVTGLRVGNSSATSVVEGLKLVNSNDVVVRDSVLNPGGIGVIFGGGNLNVKFVNVEYGSVQFADALDTLQYYDYVDLFLPSPNATQVAVRDGTGALVHSSVVTGGLLRRLELHLFNQSQSSVRSFSPFTFEVAGLEQNRSYTIMHDGGVSSTVAPDANGTLTFQLNLTDQASIAITDPPDRIPPAAIRDLRTEDAGSGMWRVLWTAPGDDGSSGTAYRYEIRYSDRGPLTPENWSAARLYPQSWVPLSAGSLEEHVVSGFDPSVEYWVAVRAVDKVLNVGNVSNSGWFPRLVSQFPLISLRILSTRVVTRADLSVRLAAVAYDTEGREVFVGLNWTASNGTVGGDGTYVPWSTGYWNVCASYGNLSDCTVVTVVPGRLAELAAYPRPIRLRVGDSAQLTFGAFDGRGNPIANLSTSWLVSPASLGSVSSRNVFEAADVGQGTISLTGTDHLATLQAVIDVTVETSSGGDGSPGLAQQTVLSFLATLLVSVLLGASILGTISSVSRMRRGPPAAEPVEEDLPDEGPGEATPERAEPVRYECPICHTVVSALALACPTCGARFDG